MPIGIASLNARRVFSQNATFAIRKNESERRREKEKTKKKNRCASTWTACNYRDPLVRRWGRKSGVRAPAPWVHCAPVRFYLTCVLTAEVGRVYASCLFNESQTRTRGLSFNTRFLLLAPFWRSGQRVDAVKMFADFKRGHVSELPRSFITHYCDNNLSQLKSIFPSFLQF